MPIHVATVGLINIVNGSPMPTNSMTVAQAAISNREHRLIVDPSIPNTIGNPTIKEYLENEYNDGYNLVHMDQYYIVTQT